MAARMVDAIPAANTNLAGFGAICFPSWQTKSLGRIVRTEPGEMCELLHTSPLVQKMMGSQCSATARGWSLVSALFAAVAQPTDEPSDHERGDDQPDAGEHIGENDSGAGVDGHDARGELATMPLYSRADGLPVQCLRCFWSHGARGEIGQTIGSGYRRGHPEFTAGSRRWTGQE